MVQQKVRDFLLLVAYVFQLRICQIHTIRPTLFIKLSTGLRQEHQCLQLIPPKKWSGEMSRGTKEQLLLSQGIKKTNLILILMELHLKVTTKCETVGQHTSSRGDGQIVNNNTVNLACKLIAATAVSGYSVDILFSMNQTGG